jgi:predicted RNase H-like nuclease (RuvC/YqgF family)
MSKPKETYSTRKAWGIGTETETDAQVELFERLAAGLRKEKEKLKKDKKHLQKKLTEKELYIEQLENKLESVIEQLASYENEKAIRLLP